MATTRLRALAEMSPAEFRDSIVVSISACHADDPGSIPGRGVLIPPAVARRLSAAEKTAPYWD